MDMIDTLKAELEDRRKAGTPVRLPMGVTRTAEGRGDGLHLHAQSNEQEVAVHYLRTAALLMHVCGWTGLAMRYARSVDGPAHQIILILGTGESTGGELILRRVYDVEIRRIGMPTGEKPTLLYLDPSSWLA